MGIEQLTHRSRSAAKQATVPESPSYFSSSFAGFPLTCMRSSPTDDLYIPFSSSCIKTVPVPTSLALMVSTNGLLKFGAANTGAEINRPLILLKAS